jgi:hypothetical protein
MFNVAIITEKRLLIGGREARRRCLWLMARICEAKRRSTATSLWRDAGGVEGTGTFTRIEKSLLGCIL